MAADPDFLLQLFDNGVNQHMLKLYSKRYGVNPFIK